MTEEEQVSLDQLLQVFSQIIPELNNRLKHKQRRDIEQAYEQAVVPKMRRDMKGIPKADIISLVVRLLDIQNQLGNRYDRTDVYKDLVMKLHKFAYKNLDASSLPKYY